MSKRLYCISAVGYLVTQILSGIFAVVLIAGIVFAVKKYREEVPYQDLEPKVPGANGANKDTETPVHFSNSG